MAKIKKRRVSARRARSAGDGTSGFVDSIDGPPAPPKEAPVQQTEEERKVQERTRTIDRAEAVLSALRNDKPEEAKLQTLELARYLGAEIFTKNEVISLLHLGEDARKANVSIYGYVDVLKTRIALYELATQTSLGDVLSSWVMSSLGFGAAYMAATGMAERAPK